MGRVGARLRRTLATQLTCWRHRAETVSLIATPLVLLDPTEQSTASASDTVRQRPGPRRASRSRSRPAQPQSSHRRTPRLVRRGVTDRRGTPVLLRPGCVCRAGEGQHDRDRSDARARPARLDSCAISKSSRLTAAQASVPAPPISKAAACWQRGGCRLRRRDGLATCRMRVRRQARSASRSWRLA